MITVMFTDRLRFVTEYKWNCFCHAWWLYVVFSFGSDQRNDSQSSHATLALIQCRDIFSGFYRKPPLSMQILYQMCFFYLFFCFIFTCNGPGMFPTQLKRASWLFLYCWERFWGNAQAFRRKHSEMSLPACFNKNKALSWSTLKMLRS